MNKPIYKYLLDRAAATKALNEGFVIVFGAKHRAFIEQLADQMIDLGMANGRRLAHDLVIHADRIYSNFEMAEKKILEQSKVDAMVQDLKLFFSDEEIEKMKVRNDTEIHPQLYMQGLDKFETLIVDTIKDVDATCKNPKPFFYFKDFPVSSEKQFSSCTLYSESGLGLDQYRPVSMMYYKEEGELCYPIEDVCRKYHYLGQMLAKQEALLSWVEKIKTTMKPDTNYFVRQYMAAIIYKLSLESASDEIIYDVQNATGIPDGFMTHKQVSQRISKWSKTSEGKKALDQLGDSTRWTH